MTFHKTKRAVICAVTASWLVLCIASPSAAQAEDSEADVADGEGASKEGSGKEKSRLNSVRLSGAYAFHLLRDRDSAVLAVAPRGIDIFGVLVLGVITAIGGGTLRDVIIDAPVFWGADLMYIGVAVAASLAAFSATSLFAFRAAAIHWNLSVPDWLATKTKEQN